MNKRILIFAVIFGVFISACGGNVEPTSAPTITSLPPPTSTPLPPTATTVSPTLTPTEVPPTLAEQAEMIAADVGAVKASFEGDPERVVYLFGENHASIGGRLEIAMMMNRLYAQQGVRHLALEGWMANDPPMDLSWAHRPPPYQPGTPITSREDVLVHMVKDGELNSAEFLGLVYDDVVVHGIDNPELYAVTIEPEIWNTPYEYNYQIAISMMNDDDYDFWLDLINDEEYQVAYDFAMKSVEYSQEMLERLRDKNSAEDFVLLLDELEVELKKWAEEYGNPIPPLLVGNMESLRDFMDVVIQRSEAMAANTLSLLDENPDQPIAFSTGLMHADRILEIFEEADITYVYIWPHALTLDEDPTRMSPEAFQSKEAGESPGEEGTIGALLRDSRNTPPTGEQVRVQQEEAIRELLQLLVHGFYETYGEESQGPTDMTDVTDNIPGFVDIFVATGLEEIGKTKYYYVVEESGDEWATLEVTITLPDGSEVPVTVALDPDSKTKLYMNLEEVLYGVREDVYNPEEADQPPSEGAFKARKASPNEFYQSCSDSWYEVGTSG